MASDPFPTDPVVLLVYHEIVPLPGDPVRVTVPGPQTLPAVTMVGLPGSEFTVAVTATLAPLLSHPVVAL